MWERNQSKLKPLRQSQPNISQVQVIKPTYTFLQRHKQRKLLLVGGAGSGKSWTVGQWFLFDKFYKEHTIRILVVRKTLPSLRKSAYQLLLDMLHRYHLPHKLNKTEMVISNTRNHNDIIFASLDDIEKIKSIEGINYVWIEEATEITHKDYMQLNLRMRAQNLNPDSLNQLVASFNPIDPRSFLKPLTENPPEDTAVNKSTYKNNPFLAPEYCKSIEDLIHQDVTYYKIYALNQWATPGNIIYTKWKTIPKMPHDSRFDRIGYGLDFGYNAPSALVKIGVKEDKAYEQELLYETHLTNKDLIERLKLLIPPCQRMRPLYADAAEPDRIQEIYNAGFNIHPCTKGRGSVKNGIDRVKTFLTFVTASSTNLIMEKETYKWREDKFGEILDEPVAYRDHLMDAERYFLGEQPMVVDQVISMGEYQWA